MDFLKGKISEVFNKDKREVKTLGEISIEKIFTGNQKITPGYKKLGDFPAVTADDVMYSEIYTKKGGVSVDKSLGHDRPFVQKGDLLIIYQGFTEEYLGKPCVYLGEQDCIAGNNIAIIKHSQNPKFLAYLFSSQYIKKQLKLLYKGGNRPYLNKEDLKKIKLLLPDLETQNRIADFMDKFIHLKSELAFEKEKRRKGWNNLNIIGTRYSEEMRKKYFEKLEA